MKKLIVTCAMLARASVVTFAQSAKSAKATMSMQSAAAPAPAQVSPAIPPAVIKTAETRAKAIQKKYSLTQAQYNGIYEAEMAYAQQEYMLKADGVTPGEGQAMQMRMGRDYRFKSVMTAEQYKKYEAATAVTK